MLLNYRDAGSVCSPGHDFTGELINVQQSIFLFSRKRCQRVARLMKNSFLRAGWDSLKDSAGAIFRFVESVCSEHQRSPVGFAATSEIFLPEASYARCR